MIKTIAAVSIFLLASVVFTFLYRRQAIKYNFSLFCFLSTLFFTELIMLITSSIGIRNHYLGNISSLLINCASIWLVSELWNHILGYKKSTKNIAILSVCIFCTAWALENLMVRSLWTYNTYVAAGAAFFMVLVIIYLINQLLFIKSDNIFRDPEGLILLGLLVRFFANCLISIFLNFRFEYSPTFYSNVLFLATLVEEISTVFFLMAVLWLPERKKYTWPF